MSAATSGLRGAVDIHCHRSHAGVPGHDSVQRRPASPADDDSAAVATQGLGQTPADAGASAAISTVCPVVRIWWVPFRGG